MLPRLLTVLIFLFLIVACGTAGPHQLSDAEVSNINTSHLNTCPENQTQAAQLLGGAPQEWQRVNNTTKSGWMYTDNKLVDVKAPNFGKLYHRNNDIIPKGTGWRTIKPWFVCDG